MDPLGWMADRILKSDNMTVQVFWFLIVLILISTAVVGPIIVVGLLIGWLV